MAFSASGALGLVADPPGNVYVAIKTGDPARTGVYRVPRDRSVVERLPGSGDLLFANALTFDPGGNVHVTDSVAGSVWRFPEYGSVGEVWIQHALLEPSGDTLPDGSLLPGANRIVFVPPNHSFMANTSRNWIADVRIAPNGSPDVQAMPVGFIPAPDGLAADAHGDIYAVIPAGGLIPGFTIVVARTDARNGAVTPLAFSIRRIR